MSLAVGHMGEHMLQNLSSVPHYTDLRLVRLIWTESIIPRKLDRARFPDMLIKLVCDYYGDQVLNHHERTLLDAGTDICCG
jgi:hypothetical protein